MGGYFWNSLCFRSVFRGGEKYLQFWTVSYMRFLYTYILVYATSDWSNIFICQKKKIVKCWLADWSSHTLHFCGVQKCDGVVGIYSVSIYMSLADSHLIFNVSKRYMLSILGFRYSNVWARAFVCYSFDLILYISDDWMDSFLCVKFICFWIYVWKGMHYIFIWKNTIIFRKDDDDDDKNKLYFVHLCAGNSSCLHKKKRFFACDTNKYKYQRAKTYSIRTFVHIARTRHRQPQP